MASPLDGAQEKTVVNSEVPQEKDKIESALNALGLGNGSEQEKPDNTIDSALDALGLSDQPRTSTDSAPDAIQPSGISVDSALDAIQPSGMSVDSALDLIFQKKPTDLPDQQAEVAAPETATQESPFVPKEAAIFGKFTQQQFSKSLKKASQQFYGMAMNDAIREIEMAKKGKRRIKGGLSGPPVSGMMSEATGDVYQEELSPEAARRIIERQSENLAKYRKQFARASTELEKMPPAESIGKFVRWMDGDYKPNPLEIPTLLLSAGYAAALESSVQTLVPMGAAFLTGPAGPAVAGITGLLVEASASFVDKMRQEGVDLTDGDAVEAFLKDEQKAKDAMLYSVKRGAGVGVGEAFGAGFLRAGGKATANVWLRVAENASNKMRYPGANALGKTLLHAGGAVAGEGITESFGEALAQVFGGDEISRSEIALEGLAGMFSGGGMHTAGSPVEFSRQKFLNKRRQIKEQNIEESSRVIEDMGRDQETNEILRDVDRESQRIAAQNARELLIQRAEQAPDDKLAGNEARRAYDLLVAHDLADGFELTVLQKGGESTTELSYVEPPVQPESQPVPKPPEQPTPEQIEQPESAEITERAKTETLEAEQKLPEQQKTQEGLPQPPVERITRGSSSNYVKQGGIQYQEWRYEIDDQSVKAKVTHSKDDASLEIYDPSTNEVKDFDEGVELAILQDINDRKDRYTPEFPGAIQSLISLYEQRATAEEVEEATVISYKTTTPPKQRTGEVQEAQEELLQPSTERVSRRGDDSNYVDQEEVQYQEWQYEIDGQNVVATVNYGEDGTSLEIYDPFNEVENIDEGVELAILQDINEREGAAASQFPSAVQSLINSYTQDATVEEAIEAAVANSETVGDVVSQLKGEQVEETQVERQPKASEEARIAREELLYEPSEQGESIGARLNNVRLALGNVYNEIVSTEDGDAEAWRTEVTQKLKQAEDEYLNGQIELGQLEDRVQRLLGTELVQSNVLRHGDQNARNKIGEFGAKVILSPEFIERAEAIPEPAVKEKTPKKAKNRKPPTRESKKVKKTAGPQDATPVELPKTTEPVETPSPAFEPPPNAVALERKGKNTYYVPRINEDGSLVRDDNNVPMWDRLTETGDRRAVPPRHRNVLAQLNAQQGEEPAIADADQELEAAAEEVAPISEKIEGAYGPLISARAVDEVLSGAASELQENIKPVVRLDPTTGRMSSIIQGATRVALSVRGVLNARLRAMSINDLVTAINETWISYNNNNAEFVQNKISNVIEGLSRKRGESIESYDARAVQLLEKSQAPSYVFVYKGKLKQIPLSQLTSEWNRRVSAKNVETGITRVVSRAADAINVATKVLSVKGRGNTWNKGLILRRTGKRLFLETGNESEVNVLLDDGKLVGIQVTNFTAPDPPGYRRSLASPILDTDGNIIPSADLPPDLRNQQIDSINNLLLEASYSGFSLEEGVYVNTSVGQAYVQQTPGLTINVKRVLKNGKIGHEYTDVKGREEAIKLAKRWINNKSAIPIEDPVAAAIMAQPVIDAMEFSDDGTLNIREDEGQQEGVIRPTEGVEGTELETRREEDAEITQEEGEREAERGEARAVEQVSRPQDSEEAGRFFADYTAAQFGLIAEEGGLDIVIINDPSEAQSLKQGEIPAIIVPDVESLPEVVQSHLFEQAEKEFGIHAAKNLESNSYLGINAFAFNGISYFITNNIWASTTIDAINNLEIDVWAESDYGFKLPPKDVMALLLSEETIGHVGIEQMISRVLGNWMSIEGVDYLVQRVGEDKVSVQKRLENKLVNVEEEELSRIKKKVERHLANPDASTRPANVYNNILISLFERITGITKEIKVGDSTILNNEHRLKMDGLDPATAPTRRNWIAIEQLQRFLINKQFLNEENIELLKKNGIKVDQYPNTDEGKRDLARDVRDVVRKEAKNPNKQPVTDIVVRSASPSARVSMAHEYLAHAIAYDFAYNNKPFPSEAQDLNTFESLIPRRTGFQTFFRIKKFLNRWLPTGLNIEAKEKELVNNDALLRFIMATTEFAKGRIGPKTAEEATITFLRDGLALEFNDLGQPTGNSAPKVTTKFNMNLLDTSENPSPINPGGISNAELIQGQMAKLDGGQIERMTKTPFFKEVFDDKGVVSIETGNPELLYIFPTEDGPYGSSTVAFDENNLGGSFDLSATQQGISLGTQARPIANELLMQLQSDPSAFENKYPELAHLLAREAGDRSLHHELSIYALKNMMLDQLGIKRAFVGGYNVIHSESPLIEAGEMVPDLKPALDDLIDNATIIGVTAAINSRLVDESITPENLPAIVREVTGEEQVEDGRGKAMSAVPEISRRIMAHLGYGAVMEDHDNMGQRWNILTEDAVIPLEGIGSMDYRSDIVEGTAYTGVSDRVLAEMKLVNIPTNSDGQMLAANGEVSIYDDALSQEIDEGKEGVTRGYSLGAAPVATGTSIATALRNAGVADSELVRVANENFEALSGRTSFTIADDLDIFMYESDNEVTGTRSLVAGDEHEFRTNIVLAVPLQDGSYDIFPALNVADLIPRVADIRNEPSTWARYLYKLVRTDKFKTLFGEWESDPFNSGVLDDVTGEPALLFRGDVMGRGELKPSRLAGFTGSGIYTTSSMSDAHDYARTYGDNAISLNARMRNLDEAASLGSDYFWQKYPDFPYDQITPSNLRSYATSLGGLNIVPHVTEMFVSARNPFDARYVNVAENESDLVYLEDAWTRAHKRVSMEMSSNDQQVWNFWSLGEAVARYDGELNTLSFMDLRNAVQAGVQSTFRLDYAPSPIGDPTGQIVKYILEELGYDGLITPMEDAYLTEPSEHYHAQAFYAGGILPARSLESMDSIRRIQFNAQFIENEHQEARKKYLHEIASIPVPKNEQGIILTEEGKTSIYNYGWGELAYRMVRTPSFKSWFGDWQDHDAIWQGQVSKVVDPRTGEPRPIYHGTESDFDEFSNRSRYEFDTAVGWHFAADVGVAEQAGARLALRLRPATFVDASMKEYSRSLDIPRETREGGDYYAVGGNIMPVFLNIRNLATVDNTMLTDTIGMEQALSDMFWNTPDGKETFMRLYGPYFGGPLTSEEVEALRAVIPQYDTPYLTNEETEELYEALSQGRLPDNDKITSILYNKTIDRIKEVMDYDYAGGMLIDVDKFDVQSFDSEMSSTENSKADKLRIAADRLGYNYMPSLGFFDRVLINLAHTRSLHSQWGDPSRGNIEKMVDVIHQYYGDAGLEYEVNYEDELIFADDGTSYIAFNPTQIKSLLNSGGFSDTDGRIQFNSNHLADPQKDLFLGGNIISKEDPEGGQNLMTMNPTWGQILGLKTWIMEKEMPDPHDRGAYLAWLAKRHQIENVEVLTQRQVGIDNDPRSLRTKLYSARVLTREWGRAGANAPEQLLTLKSQAEGVRDRIQREWASQNDRIRKAVKKLSSRSWRRFGLREGLPDQVSEALNLVLQNPRTDADQIMFDAGIPGIQDLGNNTYEYESKDLKNLVEAIKGSRKLIDKTTEMFINAGFLSPQQRKSFKEHLGIYVHRSYRMNETNEWWGRVNEIEREADARGEEGPITKAKGYLKNQHFLEYYIVDKWNESISPVKATATKAKKRFEKLSVAAKKTNSKVTQSEVDAARSAWEQAQISLKNRMVLLMTELNTQHDARLETVQDLVDLRFNPRFKHRRNMPGPEDMNLWADAWLEAQITGKAPEVKMWRLKYGANTLPSDILKKRIWNLPEEIREVFGEHRDALHNFASTMQKMSSLFGRMMYFHNVREMFNDSLFFENSDRAPEGWRTPIQEGAFKGDLEGFELLNPLAGVFTNKNIAKTLLEDSAPSRVTNPFLKALMGIIAYVKVTKTVGNPAGHNRNALANVLISIAAGHMKEMIFGGKKHVEAFWSIYRRKPNELAKRLFADGITAETAPLGDINFAIQAAGGESMDAAVYGALRRAVLKDRDAISAREKVSKASGRFGNFIISNPVARFGFGAYKAEDQIFKSIGYVAEMNRRHEILTDLFGLSDEDATRHISSMVLNMYPSFDRLNKTWKMFRWLPVGSFYAFFVEVPRVTKNSIKYGISDIVQGATALHAPEKYNIDPSRKDLARKLIKQGVGRIASSAAVVVGGPTVINLGMKLFYNALAMPLRMLVGAWGGDDAEKDDRDRPPLIQGVTERSFSAFDPEGSIEVSKKADEAIRRTLLAYWDRHGGAIAYLRGGKSLLYSPAHFFDPYQPLRGAWDPRTGAIATILDPSKAERSANTGISPLGSIWRSVLSLAGGIEPHKNTGWDAVLDEQLQPILSPDITWGGILQLATNTGPFGDALYNSDVPGDAKRAAIEQMIKLASTPWMMQIGVDKFILDQAALESDTPNTFREGVNPRGRIYRAFSDDPEEQKISRRSDIPLKPVYELLGTFLGTRFTEADPNAAAYWSFKDIKDRIDKVYEQGIHYRVSADGERYSLREAESNIYHDARVIWEDYHEIFTVLDKPKMGINDFLEVKMREARMPNDLINAVKTDRRSEFVLTSG